MFKGLSIKQITQIFLEGEREFDFKQPKTSELLPLILKDL